MSEPSDDEFFKRYPPETVVPRIRARAEQRKKPRTPFFIALSVAAASLAVVSGLLLAKAEPAGADAMRTKGTASLMVFRRDGEKAERLENHVSAREGDIVQLRYFSPDSPYGALLSLDGAHHVTVHAASLEVGKEIALPTAYRLDAAPGLERFVLITSTEPLQLDAVLAAAQAVADSSQPEAPLLLQTTARQVSVTLLKENP